MKQQEGLARENNTNLKTVLNISLKEKSWKIIN